MFKKKTKNGKFRFIEKFYDEKRSKWRQTEITMNSASRQSSAEAKRLLTIKIEKLKSELTHSEAQTLSRKLLTVRELYEEWRDIRYLELKATTFKVQNQIFESLLRTLFDKSISEVTVKNIHEIIFKGNRSIKTKRAYKALLTQFFDYALMLQFISENPVSQIHLPKRKITLDDVQKSKERFLNFDELEEIITFAKHKNMNLSNNHNFFAENQKRYLLSYIFLFCTGLRVGEPQALKFSDIEENVAHISHSIDRRNHKENERVLVSPKTIHSFRNVLLNNQALEIIEYFKTNCKDKEFIFVNQNGELLVYKTLHQNFKKLCQKALGTNKNYSLHMLRHSAISYMSEIGLPEKAIMAQVGHVKSDMTLHYTHLTRQMQSQTTSQLNKLNFSLNISDETPL
jgi:Site-specific recombinase XerD